LVSKRKFTPLDYGIFYSGNQLKLLKSQEIVDETNNIIKLLPKETWRAVIEIYGTLVVGQTQIRLELPIGTELIGTIAYHPTDPYILLFEPIEDTIPANTLSAVNAIINPINVTVDSELLSPTNGTRYLLTDDIGDFGNIETSIVWGEIVAKANDIIEYDGSKWILVFDSHGHNEMEYVTNTNTNTQYRWTGDEWVKSVEGIYRGGEWSIVI
jgi:hypothetical protein